MGRGASCPSAEAKAPEDLSIIRLWPVALNEGGMDLAIIEVARYHLEKPAIA